MTSPADTRPQDLLKAANIGREAGLRYIYAGNLPGRVGNMENTHCQTCGKILIGRSGYFIQEYNLNTDGQCPSCRAQIPGRWSQKFDGQIAATPFRPQSKAQKPAQLVKISTR
jgi:pyruvate formate lyase activating enzyme